MLFYGLIKNSIDPFLMHLLVVPIVTIFGGVLAAGYSKKAYVAPIVTLVLSILFDAIFFNGIGINSPIFRWHVTLSIISFIIAIVVIKSIKFNNVYITKN